MYWKKDVDIWKDEDPAKIDVEKYRKFALCNEPDVYWRRDWSEYKDFDEYPYVKEPNIKTESDRVAQWRELEKKYGTEIYFDLIPRQMPTAEYQRRALELYENGAERFSMWDTYNRVPIRAQWTMASRLGHKEELKSWSDGEGELFSRHRLLKIGGQNVSMYRPMWGG